MKKLLLIFALALPCYGQILAPIMQKATSGGGTATPVRSTNHNSASSGTAITSNNFTVVSGDYIVGYVQAFGGGLTPGSGFTDQFACANDTSSFWEDKNIAGTTAVADGTNAGSSAWISYGMGFKKGAGTPGLVQCKTISPSSVSTISTPNLASNVTTGNLLVGCIRLTNASSPTFTFSDTLGNTWTDVGAGVIHTAPSFTLDVQCKWAMSASTGTDALTISWTGGAASGDVSFVEISNIASN